ncbi:MAG: hypothetical protein L3J79_11820, partial [Candidatus Marinimicrobia bacterium]|nr:hypothetical protein [Candidatus Neomarinimicrobiota bacterium]
MGFDQYGSSGEETVSGLGTDALGNVYLAGDTNEVLNGGVTGPFLVKYSRDLQTRQLVQMSDSTDYLGVEADGDIYLYDSKLDRNFNLLWTQLLPLGDKVLDGRGYLYSSSGEIYRDARLPVVTLDAVGSGADASLALSGTVSSDASITVSVDTGATVSNIQKPSATTWSADLTGLTLGESNIEVVAQNTIGLKGYAYGTGTFENQAPEITGQRSLTVEKNGSYPVTLSDLFVLDPDSNFPSDFTLTVLDGSDYDHVGNQVSPFDDSGDIDVSVIVNDGYNDSDVFDLLVSIVDTTSPEITIDSFETPLYSQETTISGFVDEADVTLSFTGSSEYPVISHAVYGTVKGLQWRVNVPDLVIGDNNFIVVFIQITLQRSRVPRTIHTIRRETLIFLHRLKIEVFTIDNKK